MLKPTCWDFRCHLGRNAWPYSVCMHRRDMDYEQPTCAGGEEQPVGERVTDGCDGAREAQTHLLVACPALPAV
jgi:hypothetical protein